MNILLWYLPFAMFSETCDLVVSEYKAPPQGKPNEVRTHAGTDVGTVTARAD